MPKYTIMLCSDDKKRRELMKKFSGKSLCKVVSNVPKDNTQFKYVQFMELLQGLGDIEKSKIKKLTISDFPY